jgi:hypothetical protein
MLLLKDKFFERYARSRTLHWLPQRFRHGLIDPCRFDTKAGGAAVQTVI